ncbi:MAG: hemerythrin domain-containing protein [Woeseiaceae bacterium]|nr:hemerythrin domain-containing protein [Woeseiaceae bacterium]
MTTIFEALRDDHDRQRALLDKLEDTEGASPERTELFTTLKAELADHAAAEEKHFYSELMNFDVMLGKARHGVAEHKELDDRVEELESIDHSNPQWLVRFRELAHRVRHHLEEEEHEVFQMAGKALDDDQKSSLASAYRDEMSARRG